MIKHNSYFGGSVQSLGFETRGAKATVGVMEPGVHDFGVASIPEEITVIAGSMGIKGKQYGPGRTENVARFEAGEKIVFEVSELSAYLCRY